MEGDSELIALRRAKIGALREAGAHPFANNFRVDTTCDAFRQKYEPVAADALGAVASSHAIAGRVVLLRSFGKAAFIVLQDRSGRMQAYIKKDEIGESSYEVFRQVDAGDFVGVVGTPMRTKTGELTIQAQSFQMLTKSIRPLPEKWHGLTDKETRYRQRYVDLIVNQDVAHTFRQRSAIVRYIRNFLDGHGFLEVETPMMHSLVSGAAARPFRTHHNALDLDLVMRIAPELHLKRLVVGGLERVYEINRNFRNEGLSLQHNPEFTMLEFYCAYWAYQDLMDLTERMISGLVQELHGKTTITYHPDPTDRDKPIEEWKALELRFAAPWRRVPMFDLVREELKAPPVAFDTLTGAATFAWSIAAGTYSPDLVSSVASGARPARDLGEVREKRFRADVVRRATISLSQGPALQFVEREGSLRADELLDFTRAADETIPLADRKLAIGDLLYFVFEERLESTLIQPTFVTDFPLAASPLARKKDSDPSLTDRFELFIAGREIANAFSELNDPEDQEGRFRLQALAKAAGNEETMDYDKDYIRALEHGLPPTAGQGIGIDRLVMLLTDQPSIRDVILFPLMRPSD